MKRNTAIIAIVLVALILSATVYGTYSLYFSNGSSSLSPTSTPNPIITPTQTPTSTSTSSPSNSPTSSPTATPTATASSQTPSPTPTPTSVIVTDGAGNTMTIPLPVTKIAALDGGIAEILCAMGCQNLIVGRTESCTMPPSILSVKSYGENDYAPNVEALITLKPDIIFASSMLPYNPTAYQQLKNAGIPVYILDTTTPEPTNPFKMTKDELYNVPTPIDFTCGLMQNLTSIVGHQGEATTYINWAQNYNKLVKDRIYTLTPSQQVKTYLEWYGYGRTFVTASVYQAGGINIAENQTVYSPTLSNEFIVEQNPSAIIALISSPTHNINDFIAAKNDIISRTALQNVDAVKYGRVYICDFYARNGVRAVVGYLYWAKWLQPSLFSDIDPGTVNQELNQKFFGTAIAGTFAYP
ncbi:MAG: ABC transporter substrate-binding protein [Candidatus Bathyarchaeota archaeon]|nr:ABC transporter substrate-binding protein [Candidatus Bathyarchaeota archaeon]